MNSHSRRFPIALTICLLAVGSAFAQQKSWNKVIVTNRPPKSGGSGSHQHSGHHHHNHGGSGFRFTPYIGAYPGTGYFGGGCYGGGLFGGGFYGSSYSRIYSPFGGSFFYGTVSPSYYGPYYGNSFNNYGPDYFGSPLTYQVPRLPTQTPLVDQLRVAEQFRQDALKEEEAKRVRMIGEARPEIPLKALKVSTTQQRLRSQRLQMNGDQIFRQQRYQEALRIYRDANHAAPDRPGPYFRMAVTYAIEGKYESSVAFLKRTLEMEPGWPQVGDSLTALFGDENMSERSSLLIEMSRWVEADIRDPDRSLLLGAMLYDIDREKAVAFLETSAKLAGSADYVAPYLETVSIDTDAGVVEPKVVLPNDASPYVVTPSKSEEGRVIPPLPDFIAPKPPEPMPEESQDSQKHVPSNLGFTAPEHRGKLPVSPKTGPVLIDPAPENQ